MDAQRTPEDRVTQNELICEKLLGWVKRPSDIPGISFSGWCVPNGPDESTPSFTTWAEAGLILDALKVRDCSTTLGFHKPVLFHFLIYVGPDQKYSGHSDAGPLAVRAAALEYIRSLP